MQPNRLQDSTAQLTYSLTTDPMPVQVSLSTTQISDATLTFVVSCPVSVGAVTISKIQISLPFDSGGYTDPTNLCMTQPPLSSASISSEADPDYPPVPWTVSQNAAGDFIFTPKGGPVDFSTQNLTIEFRNLQINTLVGTALITITEYYSATSTGTQTVAVAKFPYGFYVGNFTSDKPMVKNGEAPVLSWSGSSNAKYLMLYESTTVDVSNVQSWSPPGLTQMTTFILQVSAQEGDQTATMDLSITIEVDNPSLVAQDLTVLTSSTLKGPVNVGASSAPANLVVNGDVQAKKNLSVDGTLNANAAATVIGTLNVSGAASLSNTLNVTGGVSFGNSLSVAGSATFNGGLTANSGMTANNGLNVKNGLILTGATSIFKWLPEKLGNAWSLIYQAASDGLLIGTVYPTTTTGFYYNLTIYANSYTFQARATGGGTPQTYAGSSGNYQAVQTSAMFTLPVLKGDVITMGYLTPTNPRNLPLPSFAFYWYPIGTGSLIPVAAADKKAKTSKKAKASKKVTKPAAKKILATKKKATVKKKPAVGKTRKR